MSFKFEILLFVTTFLLMDLNLSASQGNPPLIPSEKKQALKPSIKVKPARTIADTAEEYWIENKCIYPPKAFFGLFRDACEVRLKAETFYSGICQAFFNSSKQLCKLEGANEDDVQTMLSIRDMQETIDDDALCDTLADIKTDKPELFPASKSKIEKWFESISSFIFSPDTCSNACAMEGLHPICYGYMLNYNFLAHPDLSKMRGDGKENEHDDNSFNDEKSDDTVDELIIDDVDDIQNNIGDNEDEMDFGINQTSLDNPDTKGYKDIGNKASIDLSKVFNKNSDDFVDLLAMDTALMDSKELSPDIEDFDYNPDFQVQKFAEMETSDSDIPVFYRGARPRLRGYRRKEMDGSEEVPMLGAVLGVSALLAVICFVVLFGLRKKMGLFMRHIHHNRRNNWNYERVLAAQPDDDDYYE